MTEKMKKALAEILEKTTEPISGLSVAGLAVVKGIKFNALSERFTVYLDMHRIALVTSTFFFVTGNIQLEDILLKALQKVYPNYTVRFYYVGGSKITGRALRLR